MDLLATVRTILEKEKQRLAETLGKEEVRRNFSPACRVLALFILAHSFVVDVLKLHF